VVFIISNVLLLSCSEWYSYHFPELVKIVTDNYTYARVAQYIGNRKQLVEDRLDGLEKILLDSEKTRAIYDASRSSMGNAFLQHVCMYTVNQKTGHWTFVSNLPSANRFSKFLH